MNIVVQVDGKIRGHVLVTPTEDTAFVARLAQLDENVQKFLSGRVIVKTAYVPGFLINFITRKDEET